MDKNAFLYIIYCTSIIALHYKYGQIKSGTHHNKNRLSQTSLNLTLNLFPKVGGSWCRFSSLSANNVRLNSS